MLTRADVIFALVNYPHKYETPDGRVFYGLPVSELPSRLRECGWRNVSRFNDNATLEALGLEIVTARYVGGVRPKRLCFCVVGKDATLSATSN